MEAVCLLRCMSWLWQLQTCMCPIIKYTAHQALVRLLWLYSEHVHELVCMFLTGS